MRGTRQSSLISFLIKCLFKPKPRASLSLIRTLHYFIIGRRQIEKKNNELLKCAEAKVEEYSDVLIKKYRQLAYKDDYGIIRTNKYEAELKYFMDNIIDSKKIMSKEMRQYIIERTINFMKENVNFNETLFSVNNPYEFEQKCAQILNESGWNARATSKSLDQGVDVIADKDGVTVVIQCKLYNKPVGNKAVQEIIAGRDFYKADFAAVVSNSTYTISARQLAQNCNVLLLNVDELYTLHEMLKIF